MNLKETNSADKKLEAIINLLGEDSEVLTEEEKRTFQSLAETDLNNISNAIQKIVIKAMERKL